jgi:hypothetical protein
MNLGVLYEDMLQYDRAQDVLSAGFGVFSRPRSGSAVLKDATASCDMFYDEEARSETTA